VTVASMTGFARADGAAAGYSWTWEAKSVNSKGLDVRFRLPPGLDSIEATVRNAASKRFARGNLSINLTLVRPESVPTIRVNREVLDQVMPIVQEFRGDAAPDIETLLTLRGVVDLVETETEDEDVLRGRDAAIVKSFDELLSALAAARLDEGKHLDAVVREHVETIDTLTEAASALAAMQPEKRRDRLRAQLDELLAGETPVAEERLAQEVALIVARGDVREELDRLRAHGAAARELLSSGTAIGRRLDFLCQEFNREANTLCSKSSDLELTRIGLDLKAAIERLREQVQNIE
jgi:uncharacterized protein (TIGR00255 family)